MRKPTFVPASRLYDVESRTPIAHPAHQATDEEVRRAVENREIRTDGGRCSSGTERTYVVSCDECGLYESYTNERIARGRKLSHWEDRQHVAEVTEDDGGSR
ncbi:hypothetical protein [Natrialba sp. SSL1]|uniref:hypothetical protein n=1 Tax=Natrialba sp. SSL1 TaxID=1869245 RepID=UPI0008F81E83|nr:hypothetical protein [Natrialba sp. SSL1]OIB56229.1 hypothetical protein BBD46_18895 [Natrialba sp. SSL1]